MENTDTTTDTTARSLGYWLRATGAMLARAYSDAFEAEGVSRRDGRLLSLLDSGDTEGAAAPGFAERLQRHGGKKLRALVERGWVAETDGRWTLTDEGRAAQARLRDAVDGIRAKIAGAVSDEDYATTLASLQAIATSLGWDDDARMPHGFGRHGFGHGFGPGFGRRGFGPGSGHRFGPREGFGPAFGPAFGPRGDHHGHHGRPGDRHTERAFERGFDAGFARGRAAQGA